MLAPAASLRQRQYLRYVLSRIPQVLESTKDTSKDDEPMCFEIGAGDIVANPLFQVEY